MEIIIIIIIIIINFRHNPAIWKNERCATWDVTVTDTIIIIIIIIQRQLVRRRNMA